MQAATQAGPAGSITHQRRMPSLEAPPVNLMLHARAAQQQTWAPHAGAAQQQTWAPHAGAAQYQAWAPHAGVAPYQIQGAQEAHNNNMGFI